MSFEGGFWKPGNPRKSAPDNRGEPLVRGSTQFGMFKVAVGPKRSTNRNLKQIIAIECTKTVILQLLRPLDISKLSKRELIE